MGNDLINGGDGNDIIRGGDGNDRLGRSGLVSEQGDDTFYGGTGDDNIYGGSGDDLIEGESGDDYLRGEDGSDILDGGTGNDMLIGGEGSDTYIFGRDGGNDHVIDYTDSTTGADMIVLGEDILPSDIQLYRVPPAGYAERDLYLAIAGTTDTLRIAQFFDENGNAVHAINQIRFADGTIWSIDEIKTQVTTGTEGDDVIYGFTGDDELSGLAGNDLINGGDGNDIIRGGEGNDRLGRSGLVSEQGDDTFYGGTGDDNIDGGSGDDLIDGESGDDYLRGEDGSDILDGGEGDDNVDGGSGDDLLIGGSGPDFLIGGPSGNSGSDTYQFNLGDEQVKILNYDDGEDVDTIAFGPGISPNEITLSRTGHDLRYDLRHSAEFVTVANYFLSDIYYIDQITFEDGTIWNDSDLNLFLENTAPSAAADRVSVEQNLSLALSTTDLMGNDIDADNDVLSIFDIENVTNGTIDFDSQAGSITFTPDSGYVGEAGFDYWVSDGKQGFSWAHVTIDVTPDNYAPVVQNPIADQLATVNESFSLVVPVGTFADADGDVLTYSASLSDGAVLPSWLSFDGVTRTLSGTSGDVATYDIAIIATDPDGASVVDTFSLAVNQAFNEINGTDSNETIYGTAEKDLINGLAGNDNLWGRDGDDILNGDAGNDWLRGENGNDVLNGGDGRDYLYGGAGDDILDGGAGSNDQLSGNAGNDTYLFAAGSGALTINNYDTGAGRHDLLRLEELLPSDVALARSSNNLTLTILSTGEAVRVSNYFSGDGTSGYALDAIEFADGTAWELETVKSLAIQGTSGADLLSGYSSDDTINGLGGNDSLSGGDGHDTLNGGAGNDSLRGENGNDVLNGGDGSDYLYGGAGDDILDGGAGSNDQLSGNAGNDTYLFAAGNGALTINNYDTGAGRHDVLRLEELLPSDVALARSSNNLTLTILSTGEAVRVSNYFSGDGTSGYALDAIEFADGTAWELETVKSLAIQGTSGADLLSGYSSDDTINGLGGNDSLSGGDGHDTLNGGAGNDSLQGENGNDVLNGGDGRDYLYGGAGDDILDGGAGSNDQLSGNAGNDTYLFAAGSGALTINNYDTGAGRYDLLRLEELLPSDVALSRSSNNLTLTILSTGEEVRVSNYFSGDGTSGYALDAIEFTDGTAWELETVKSLAIQGTSGADLLSGYSSDDTINGLSGNDSISGGDGHDTLDGGAGNDSLRGENDNDVLVGGDGNDYLYGGYGDDLLDGGAGVNSLSGDRGNDTYNCGVGDGTTTVNNYDTDVNAYDRVTFENVPVDDLWFSRSSNNLVVTIAGTDAQLKILNWFSNDSYQLDEFVSGTQSLSRDRVDELVAAMAPYSLPLGSGNNITPETQTAVQPTIDSVWQ